VHTPGHTPNQLSYVVVEDGSSVAAFTGGSMLFGTVGRTDLISAEATEGLTCAQFQSVRRLAGELPSQVDVHPTHGFGSFCSSASSSGSDASTIGQEQTSNLALTLDDEDVFVERLLSGLTAYPSYYVHMAPINQAGPGPVDLSPPEPVDPVEIRRRVHDGEWVVDLRSRTAFARGHLDSPYDEAIARVTGALKDQGFALLPCNVVVRTEQGHTIVEALDPKIIAEVPGNPALVPIAEEAGQRIQAALDALGTV